MKGKINKEGFFLIERAGEEKRAGCYYTTYPDGVISCGDWCPQFGEPEESDMSLINESARKVMGGPITILKLCQNRELIFDEFVDER